MDEDKTPSLSLQDFESSGWQEAFQGKKNSACISSALQKQAEKAIEEGKITQGRVLQLLANACSMALLPMSIDKPFHPYLVMRLHRSAAPEDFSETDIEYFQQALPLISDSWLRARLADLVWLRRRPQTEIGLIAIDAYMETPLTEESFSDKGGDYWIRALRLTRVLKKISGDREKTIESKILSACYSATEKDGFLGRWLADLLLSFEMAGDKGDDITEKLISLAKAFEAQKNHHRTRGYYEAAHNWLKKSGKEEMAFKISAALAETWNLEAVSKEADGDFIGAAHFSEKAIQAYRQIPQKYREPFGIEHKLSQLKVRHNRIGQQASTNMQFFSTPKIDISEMITKAQQSVKEKPPLEALTILANLYYGVNLWEARTRAKQALTEFHSMFPKTILSRDGRVIARVPGIISATENPEAYELAVRFEMIQHYLLEVGVVTAGRIIPALETMIIEHRLPKEFFISLCSQSAIVPPGRSRAFGKALFSGYDLDFDSAIHRLVPQMEEMVRYHLKSIGVATTMVDPQGIEEEVNLSALLEKPEAISVFGEDRVFEMDALFCEKTGPKFRHGLAHGLLEDEDFHSAPAVYAWCFALRLVLTPFWNSCVNM